MKKKGKNKKVKKPVRNKKVKKPRKKKFAKLISTSGGKPSRADF